MATADPSRDRGQMNSKLIDAYLEHLRQAGASPDTLRIRRVALRLLAAALPYGLGETEESELRAWVYRDRLSANTRATYAAAVRSFYSWAADPRDPWISHDPSINLPRVRAPRGVAHPCTDAQLSRILAEAAQPYRLWAIIAAYQGLRCCEIAGLDREHITATILHVVRGKGGAPRLHDTDPYVWAAVQDLPPGPVARLVNGARASAGEVSRRANRHFQRDLGLAGVSMHDLRHWLGVTVQREYKDPRVTQKILGHATLSSTQIYTDATAEQQRAARAMLPRLAG